MTSASSCGEGDYFWKPSSASLALEVVHRYDVVATRHDKLVGGGGGGRPPDPGAATSSPRAVGLLGRYLILVLLKDLGR